MSRFAFAFVVFVALALLVAVPSVTNAQTAPVCEPQGQGFWARQCKGLGEIPTGKAGKPGLHPAYPEDVLRGFLAEVDAYFVPFAGQTTCEALDAEPSSDVCERAYKQCAATVLNLYSGLLDPSCPVDLSGVELPAGYPEPANVEEALAILLLLTPPPSPEDCSLAHDVCAALNG